jgi:Co/Zn/Cd efflux system component
MTPVELPLVTAPASLQPPRNAAPAGEERDRLIRQAKTLSWLSLGWMTIEGAVAVTAALLAGSVALLGFGLDSAIEAMASVIVIWRFTGSRRLSEEAEQRAQTLVAISFFLLAPYIAQEAIRTLIGGAHPSTSWVGIALSVSSIVVMPLLGRAKKADRRSTWVGRDRRRGNAEPALRLHGRRRARRPARQHVARRLVA